MKNHANINSSQKILMNVSLVFLGICANGPFFAVMVTLLLGTATLTWLRHQQEHFGLNAPQTDKEAETLHLSRF